MPAGLKVYKEDGNLLFDTEKITYGLLKSGYMSLITTWPRLEYRSADLDPSSGSSYAESSFVDGIHGFSVTGAVAPIVFINGRGISCGSSKSGDTTTFYFTGASTATKYFYFDTMRNTLNGAGLKCFSEAGELTFNSLQYPLNIRQGINAPAPPTPTSLNGHLHYTQVFAGASRSGVKFAGSTMYSLVSEVFIPIAAGNYATNTSFSRSIGQGLMDSEPIPGTPFPARGNQQNHFDGAYGASGGIYFMAMEAPRTTMYWGTPVSYNRFFDIPTDRYPQALVISIDNLPFPFN
ncbi:hypothetical protein [Pseudomonas monteilii]|uniref:hypothetical protein n=1 Tax=Pseudomonas monteilii TaxID=76759 RepID=UPI0018ABBE08|nr:hypothetical protein [Pseudomonas monteilii]MBF8746912.1 hypothetical protein [Pseudomonas monteilii]